MTAEVLLIALFVLFTGFFAGVETGAYTLNRIRLRHRDMAGWWTARVLSRLLARPRAMVTMTLVGNNLGVYLATAVCTTLYGGTHYAELWSTLTLAPILLLFAEIGPKAVFRRRANSMMYALAYLIRFFYWLLWPGTFLLERIAAFWHWLLGGPRGEVGLTLSAAALRHFFIESAEERLLSQEQTRMARRIMALERVPLAGVMIPLDQVEMTPAGATTADLRALVSRRRFSRIPAYEGERERVVGIVNILDVLCDGGTDRLADLLRPAVYLDRAMAVDDAFLRLQKAKQPMGVVVDEVQRAVGIVTIKDLVEEVVGELKAW